MPDSEGASSSPKLQIQFPLPEKFASGKQGLEQIENWTKWIKRFERYRTASGLKDKTDTEQVSTLLYAMGDCADDILATLKVDESKASYSEMKTALDTYFGARRNVVVDRARFNRRVQKPGESIDSFIQDLYRLADECNYSTLKEELIRDRLVVGVLDENLSDRLQQKADLTLAQAIERCRMNEMRQENRELVRGEINKTDSSVDFVKRKQPQNNQKKTKPSSRGGSQGGKKCHFCGNEPHERKDCPARLATCNKCHKKGHYQRVCESKAKAPAPKNVHEVESPGEDDFLFLGEVTGKASDPWIAQIGVNDHNTKFKLDTGASVCVLSDSVSWLKGMKLDKPQQTLRGPGGAKLDVIGTFQATLKYRQSKIQERMYVIRNQPCSLLSKKVCVDLGLVKLNDVGEVLQSPPDFRKEFPKLFQGLGRIKTEYRITLRDEAVPVCLYTPRKVPHPLLPKVKAEIETMLKQNVISPVTVPTEWCSGIVCVPKANGRVRICVDLTQLNKGVKREIHPMPSVDESLSKLSQGKVFSKLDANSGFWQVPLDEQSKLLTTFITPFGRYCFNRLPFGISSAPEFFQRAMSGILEGLEGVVCQMDDILIHGKDQAEHDKRVRAVLNRIQDAGMTLNSKCEFNKRSIKFLAHIIDGSGIYVDPNKTDAITRYPVPTTVTELQRFLGMVNHVAKFVPRLADLNGPLRQLLHKDSQWLWGPDQQRAFQKIKEVLSSSEVLALYSPKRETIIAADASNAGIGAVLIQISDDGSRRPVYYASRSLSETEQRYAVIEKEALAATWACERFAQYVLGLKFTLETDHKPLVTLLNTTELCKTPPRIQRFRLRLMRFSPHVVYVPGKQQLTADALSRAPVGKPLPEDVMLVEEVESYVGKTLHGLPATTSRLTEIREAQKVDEECSLIRKYCTEGWPAYMPHKPLMQPYWEAQSHLAVVDDLLLYDERIVIPRSMRLEILNCIHTGHLGITKCRARARSSVWWPGLSCSIQDMVSKCSACAKVKQDQREPLLPSSFPSRPWERIGMDLFNYQGKIHLIVVDYYSRWIEIKRLYSETSEYVINVLKELFATHGIPDIAISDNGPQFVSEIFSKFADTYAFIHYTSSPKYAPANGEAERAVRTIKELLKKNKDISLALLSYRSTPLQNGLSPSELLMGRKLKTQLPVLPSTLQPRDGSSVLKAVRAKEETYRSKQEDSFNRRHRARELPTLQPGSTVWIKDQSKQGKVLSPTQYPRSYLVKTDKGILRRNRSALVSTTEEKHRAEPTEQAADTDEEWPSPQSPSPTVSAELSTPVNTSAVQTTRSGRIVRPPKRLDL